MKKHILYTILLAAAAVTPVGGSDFAAFAANTAVSPSPQGANASTGGVKGTVVDRAGRSPLAGAELTLLREGVAVARFKSQGDGAFFFENLPDGSYQVDITAPDYLPTSIFTIVEKGLVKDMMMVSMTAAATVQTVDNDSFTEFDMVDSGYSDSPTILAANHDPFNSIASYGFSSVRYKGRGYSSETQEVYLAGVHMNDAFTGFSPYGLWTGINEATRMQDNTMGLQSSYVGLGRQNGVTNIFADPESVRKGFRVSVLSNSALYRLRLMATYASGVMDNGWAYAVNVSARLGGNDWIKGVYYRNFAYYAGAQKAFSPEHKIVFATFAAPGQRGAQNASTQEVYDLMGDNMYNSNWGYQNGKVRNSRVRKTFEPVTFAKYSFTPNDDFENHLTLLWRTGYNGYTTLDWYDAQDPRPDYYRNLPSYFYDDIDGEETNKEAQRKAAYATEMWTSNYEGRDNYTHINWDKLYSINLGNEGGRSKYIVGNRRVDQNDFHIADNASWRINSMFRLDGGVQLRWNTTRNYEMVDDLMGGSYFLNVDQFAERSFASSQARIQNDLDYYIAHGQAEKVGLGGKYSYDYNSFALTGKLWGRGTFTLDALTLTAGLSGGYNSFWRRGNVRKGLFAGYNEDGSHVIVDGEDLTLLSNGQTSKGESEHAGFFEYSAKLGAGYSFKGGHILSANAGYMQDAPTFANSFVSPRTRNTLVDNLKPQKTFSTDLTYQWAGSGYNIRLTGYYTTIKDQTDVLSFYDDSQHSFTNFAMTGIDERHLGFELGASVPLDFLLPRLSLKAAVSYGNFVYTSTPRVTQTIDNSAAVVENMDGALVTYWAGTPVEFRTLSDGSFEKDRDGNLIPLKYERHHVGGTPELASSLGLSYRTKSYWFFSVDGQYFDGFYLPINPLYRTEKAVAGPLGNNATAESIKYMTTQEKFQGAFLLNASVGKSWYLRYKYQFGVNVNVSNITNNRSVRTGGYEQTRLVKASDSYKRFDPRYFYMQGINYMVNVYFKF